jgi:hypothetical protein
LAWEMRRIFMKTGPAWAEMMHFSDLAETSISCKMVSVCHGAVD